MIVSNDGSNQQPPDIDLSQMGSRPCDGDRIEAERTADEAHAPPPTAIIYGRHSSDMQNPHSADDQNAENRRWVLNELGPNAQILSFTDKAVSGFRTDRDGLADAVEKTTLLPSGVFVVESISRLGRNLAFTINLISLLVDRGWRFVSRKESCDTGAKFWPVIAALMAAFAEIENELKAEMVRRGRRQTFLRGANVGRFPADHYRPPGGELSTHIHMVRCALRPLRRLSKHRSGPVHMGNVRRHVQDADGAAGVLAGVDRAGCRRRRGVAVAAAVPVAVVTGTMTVQIVR